MWSLAYLRGRLGNAWLLLLDEGWLMLLLGLGLWG